MNPTVEAAVLWLLAMSNSESDNLIYEVSPHALNLGSLFPVRPEALVNEHNGLYLLPSFQLLQPEVKALAFTRTSINEFRLGQKLLQHLVFSSFKSSDR